MAAPFRARRVATLCQSRDRVEQPVHHALRPPQHEQRTFDLASASGGIVLQIDRRRRAIVLAGRVDRRRIGEAALVLGERAWIEMTPSPDDHPPSFLRR